MLIDMLSASLAKSGALDDAWAKLDSGQDATVGVASSARPFLVAARFAADPRATRSRSMLRLSRAFMAVGSKPFGRFSRESPLLWLLRLEPCCVALLPLKKK